MAFSHINRQIFQVSLSKTSVASNTRSRYLLRVKSSDCFTDDDHQLDLFGGQKNELRQQHLLQTQYRLPAFYLHEDVSILNVTIYFDCCLFNSCCINEDRSLICDSGHNILITVVLILVIETMVLHNCDFVTELHVQIGSVDRT